MSSVPSRGDGISILRKYATGLTPGTAGNSPTTLAAGNDALTLSFNRLHPAPVTYAVEASTDLAAWTAIATLTTGGAEWNGNVTETGTGNQRAVNVTDTTALSGNSPPLPPPASDPLTDPVRNR